MGRTLRSVLRKPYRNLPAEARVEVSPDAHAPLPSPGFSAMPGRRRRHQLGHRATGLADNDLLASSGSLDQLGERGLGLVEIVQGLGHTWSTLTNLVDKRRRVNGPA